MQLLICVAVFLLIPQCIVALSRDDPEVDSGLAHTEGKRSRKESQRAARKHSRQSERNLRGQVVEIE